MRKNKNRGYQQLRVWNDAIDYYAMTQEVFRKFPYELKRVAAQAIAPSDSVYRNTCPVKQLEVDMFYTYVLQSSDDMRFYVGYTKDLKLRFERHTKGSLNQPETRGR